MKKKVGLVSLLIIVIASALANMLYIKADSGWDSSYDGGSSWDSSDSWSSSSWDSDYSSSSSGSSEGSGVAAIIVFIIIVIIIVAASKNSKNNNSTSNRNFADASDELLNKYDINKEEFKQMMYDNYVNVQNGWMNFDYDSLKELLTDELYNTYVSQLDALKIKEEQNIMSDFNLVDAKILNVKEENNQVSVDTYLRITMYDYVVDANKKVIRGNKNHKIDIEYKITYVRPLNTDGEFTCPNCGAKLEKTTRGKCKYCRTLIVRPTSNYVMSKKQCIGQRNI